MLIKVVNLNKSYEEKKVLVDVSFEIGEQQIIALLGPNGSGKTTLFRCLSNLAVIDSGEINVNPEIILRKEDIMYVSEQPILYETLTAKEHLRFIMDINEITLEKQQIEEMLEEFQVSEFCDKKIAEYSLGMKKRVQLMCAMLRNPKVLLLDEYISGLDPISLKRVEQILNNYVKRGNTVLVATHILEIAERLCNQVLFMQDGKILKTVEDIDSIKNKYESLEQYYFRMAAKETACKKGEQCQKCAK